MELRALSAKLIQTIEDTAKWQGALRDLCAYTQTGYALISLRDKSSAEIVIPDDVSAEFASPLIYGFNEAEVEAFLSDFGEVDPWTKIERNNHPYFPYQMSRYLRQEDLRKTDFWQWLKPLQISECVVCELGSTESYWAALNLYFDPKSEAETTAVIERLKDILPVLRSVWTSGRALQVATTAADSLDIVLSAITEPAALVLQNGELVAMNDAMNSFVGEPAQRAQRNKRLGLPADLKVNQDDPDLQLDLMRTAPRGHRGLINVRAFKAAQLKDGEKRDTYLVTIEQQDVHDLSEGRDVWELDSLTGREKILVKLVAEGLKFREAQEEMGVSYPRVMQIWKSAREKLGVKDVNDLRVTHRMRRV